jgi:type IV secretory pathway VirB3-like protein
VRRSNGETDTYFVDDLRFCTLVFMREGVTNLSIISVIFWNVSRIVSQEPIMFQQQWLTQIHPDGSQEERNLSAGHDNGRPFLTLLL